MNVTHETILVNLVRKDQRIAELEATVAELQARVVAQARELAAARQAAETADAEVTRLKAELDRRETAIEIGGCATAPDCGARFGLPVDSLSG